ncbi:MAG: hypothetical protein JSU91_02230 [Thermoplasmatales archaeon]|nr:MAG: hypothetical protein JSU91_02230 [Thermoplasmatales archaeon]
MNKKIISIIFLLIILVSLALVYNYYKSSTDEKQYDTTVGTIDENNILEEIENTFIEEDDEIEIGEMV